jgi:hypothetical protein
MNEIHRILEQLQDTDSAATRFEQLAEQNPNDTVHAINVRAIRKRRTDLERRLNAELRNTQSDLVQYHVEKSELDRYPALAVAKAIAGFQELVTAVFDAIRSTPKKRYRPSAENIALSTLDFAMAAPVNSVLISLSIENERLLAIKSELDQTFERVFEILKTREPDGLRMLAGRVGIAALSKAHDWAASTAQFGLNTTIAVRKEIGIDPVDFSISNSEAQSLKEAIEGQSDRATEPEAVIGELIGIDVDADLDRSYFHVKTQDGRNLEGKLAGSFLRDQHWAVHVVYIAHVIKITTIKYATGEEKVEWVLASLIEPMPTNTPRDFPAN